MNIALYFVTNGVMLDSDFNYVYGPDDNIPFSCVISDIDKDTDLWLKVLD